jgi:hypothetical protein
MRLLASATLTALLCFTAPLNATEAYALPFLLASILAARSGAPVVCGVLVGVATIFWLPSVLMLLAALLLIPAVRDVSAFWRRRTLVRYAPQALEGQFGRSWPESSHSKSTSHVAVSRVSPVVRGSRELCTR